MDSHRNPNDYGLPFNKTSHVNPRPLAPAKREAANNRRVQLANATKAKLEPFTAHDTVRDDSAHDDFVNYLHGKLSDIDC